MTGKKYLKSIQKHKQQLVHKKQRLEDLYNAVGLTGIDYSKDLIQTSPKNSFEEKLVEIADLNREILGDIVSLENQISEAEKRIYMLDNDKHCEILYKRYIDIKSLEQISVEMGYSFDRVRHLHAEAINEFDNRHSAYLRRTWK